MFAVYLKEGYNVVRRYQKGDTPDDKIDFFEHLGCYKDLECTPYYSAGEL
mgnify:CR=1 FL=1